VAVARREPVESQQPTSMPEWVEWLLDKHGIEEENRADLRLRLGRLLVDVPEVPDGVSQHLQERAIVLEEEDFRICQRYAVTAAVGGGSQLKSAAERKDLCDLVSDQLVGHLGSLAFHTFAFGKNEGRRRFISSRERADRNPTKGDNGQDIDGQKVDFKTSLRRYQDKALGDYQLAVREREKHADTLYVLNLVEPLDHDAKRPSRLVRLVGFALEQEMTYQENDPEHVFGPKNGKPGAFIKPARELRELPKDLRALVAKRSDHRVDLAVAEYVTGGSATSPRSNVVSQSLQLAVDLLEQLDDALMLGYGDETEENLAVVSWRADATKCSAFIESALETMSALERPRPDLLEVLTELAHYYAQLQRISTFADLEQLARTSPAADDVRKRLAAPLRRAA
jgi:hypothetical protein